MWTKPLKILVIGFIWLHSALPPSLSGMESGWFLSLLSPIFGAWLSELLLRKLAHFVEYSVLGAVLAADEMPIRTHLNFGLIVAFFDETVQIFSGRGASLADVWLDLSGVLVGGLLVIAIRHFSNQFSKGHSGQ